MFCILFVSLETPFIYIFHMHKHYFLLHQIADVLHLELAYSAQDFREQSEDIVFSGSAKNHGPYIAIPLSLVELKTLQSRGIFTNHAL